MKTIDKILVPVDFSECSLHALDAAVLVAERFGAQIDVLHVWSPPYDLGPVFAPMALRDADGRRRSLGDFIQTHAGQDLKRVLEQLEKRNVRAQGRLESGEVRRGIVEAAAKGGYDLLVMGTHGRTGLAHLVIGSVAEWVARHSPVPVLMVRAPRALPKERAAEA